jgi:dTDP-4-amino-4,6-dideoxygalactose transaminase
MSDVLSALGLSQLKKIGAMTNGRNAAAARYIELLDGSPYFDLPETLPDNTHTWHLFVIRLRTERLSIDRDEFIRALAAENIGCSVHFIPIHRHPFFEPYKGSGESYPVCDDFFSRCISLPMFPSMRARDVEDVVRALNRIAGFYAKD